MGVVYHGSPIPNINELVTNRSTHGTYVYATHNKDIAIVMSHHCGDNATYSFGRQEKDGPFDLVERMPGVFDKMFSNNFSIYTLNENDFEDIHTGFEEVVSDHPVKVLSEEKMGNLFDRINKLADEGKINIYRYPDRPEYIPVDDSDLVERMKVRLTRMDPKDISIHTFTRWIFMHPNLENEFRYLGECCGLETPSYEEIKDFYIKRQEEEPNHEFFIQESLLMKEMCKPKNR